MDKENYWVCGITVIVIFALYQVSIFYVPMNAVILILTNFSFQV